MKPEEMKALSDKLDAAKAKLAGMMEKPEAATPEAMAELKAEMDGCAAMVPSKAADPAPAADPAKPPAEGEKPADPAAPAAKTDEEIHPEDQAKIDALKQAKLKRHANPFSPIKANSGL